MKTRIKEVVLRAFTRGVASYTLSHFFTHPPIKKATGIFFPKKERVIAVQKYFGTAFVFLKINFGNVEVQKEKRKVQQVISIYKLSTWKLLPLTGPDAVRPSSIRRRLRTKICRLLHIQNQKEANVGSVRFPSQQNLILKKLSSIITPMMSSPLK